MNYVNFRLSVDTMLMVANDLVWQITDGIALHGQQLKCLPTFVAIKQTLFNGDACVLDLGGSNLRAAKVVFIDGKVFAISRALPIPMPWKRGTSYNKIDYLEKQADALINCGHIQELPLGYCFSFPADGLTNGDAQLIHWTKGLHVNDTEGQLVGKTFVDYISRVHQVELTHPTVINDTVASLLAGLTLPTTDATFGLIAGTGFNTAALIPAKLIAKLPEQYSHLGGMPVNLESGNFNPSCLTEFDSLVDQESENPGMQVFEKAVSGMYLARIFHAAYPDAGVDPQQGAKGVMQFIDSNSSASAEVCSAISLMIRAAQLISIQMLGLIEHHLTYVNPKAKTFRFVCEGGLFWASGHKLGGFNKLVKDSLNDALVAKGWQALAVDICKVEQANLKGAAIAALANKQAAVQLQHSA
ncbi:hexokinase family protein [Catenovulum agarivorans]|uniref:hexokinase family protein n=1 Tax=Catenovulum agarivorans TaxID=1172192 RepID=UPI0002D4DE19|nr:hexokinase family protein [Catenovulum agarivorans]